MELFSTLPHLVQHMVNTYHNSSALNYPNESGWDRMSTESFEENIRHFALGMHSLGLIHGDTVGMMAAPSPSWLIVDLGVMGARGTSVSMFSFISEQNFLYEVKNAKLKYLVVLDAEHWSAVSMHQNLFERVIVKGVDASLEGDHVISFDDVLELGQELSKKNPSLYSELRDAVKEDDLATIIYTSGSTGIPKGVELTQKNLVSQVRAARIRFSLNPKTDRVLSMLPLAHIFERMLIYYYLSSGVSLYFVDDMKNLLSIIKKARPTLGAMVPLMVEKIYGRIQSRIESMPWYKRWLGEWILSFAAKPSCGLLCDIIHKFADKLLYAEVRESLGGCFRAIIVGGAPLGKELCQFFLNAGVPIFQGYGLTEASPVLTTNFIDHNKPGSVGKVFPGVELKISKKGEILAKGDNIMRGYRDDPDATKAIIDEEGWLHTGDIGNFDEHGFLTITGRTREIMKTSGGKMVAPMHIELKLCQIPLLEMAVIIANDKKYVSCLLFPNFEEVARMKALNKVEQMSHEDFLDSYFVKKEIDKLLEKVNSTLSAWEQVRRYQFVTTPLTMEAGELTPTMTVNRSVVLDKYEKLINLMY